MAFNILLLDPAVYGETDVWFAGQNEGTRTTKTAKDWNKQENAHLIFNLGVFDMKTGESNCYVKGNTMVSDSSGATHANIGGYSSILKINSNNECKGYSNGIINDTVSINKPMGGQRTRNGIGITAKGHVVIAQSGHNVTEKVFCTAVKSFVNSRKEKIALFVLQDGGGSTQEYSALSDLNFAPESGRKVATVVCVRFNNLPMITYPVYSGSKGRTIEVVQATLGGIACDGDFGVNSVARAKAMQKAKGLPFAMQCGVLSTVSLKALGFKTTF